MFCKCTTFHPKQLTGYSPTKTSLYDGDDIILHCDEVMMRTRDRVKSIPRTLFCMCTKFQSKRPTGNSPTETSLYDGDDVILPCDDVMMMSRDRAQSIP